jgi:glycine betaine/choline ABC-type transport system substrate-binding protein
MLSLEANLAARLILALATVFLVSCMRPTQKPLLVGSRNTTEQAVLGEIISQHVEKRLGVTIERHPDIAGLPVAHSALITGEIDLYPEYSGAVLSGILRQTAETDATVVRERIRLELERQTLEWIGPLGPDSHFVVATTATFAAESGIKTLSDTAAKKVRVQFGIPPDFQERGDGLTALMSKYDLRYKTAPQRLDQDLLFEGLKAGKFDMVAVPATAAGLTADGIQLVEDDNKAFGPSEVGVLTRRETLERIPKLRQILLELSGKIDNATLQRLNREVDLNKREPSAVAAQFLSTAGI